MPVTFRQIAARTAKVTITIEGDEDNEPMTFTVWYYPNKFTADLLAQAQAGTVTDKEYFPQIVKAWDIYEDDEHTVMFPIEQIDKFGIPFMQQFAKALGDDMLPNLRAPQKTS